MRFNIFLCLSILVITFTSVGITIAEFSCEDGNQESVLVGWETYYMREQSLYLWHNGDVIPLSTTSAIDTQLQVSDGQAIWVRYSYLDGPFVPRTIRFWDGETISDFPHQTGSGLVNFPSIDGQYVAWVEGTNVFFTNGENTVQITDNNTEPITGLDISEHRVVWIAGEAEQSDVYYWDGNDIQRLTQDTAQDYSVHIDGTDVVWETRQEETHDIRLWQGDEVQILHSTPLDSFDDTVGTGFGFPRISMGRIVWNVHDSFGTDVYYWDGEQTINITNNDNSFHPQISGDMVTWSQRDRTPIFWRDSEVTQLEIDGSARFNRVSNGYLAWVEDENIRLWDGETITQLSDNDTYVENLVISVYCDD